MPRLRHTACQGQFPGHNQSALQPFVWHGDFYAARLIDRLGLRERGGVVRASFVRLTGVLDRLL